jgi:hypothetical protein
MSFVSLSSCESALVVSNSLTYRIRLGFCLGYLVIVFAYINRHLGSLLNDIFSISEP